MSVIEQLRLKRELSTKASLYYNLSAVSGIAMGLVAALSDYLLRTEIWLLLPICLLAAFASLFVTAIMASHYDRQYRQLSHSE